VFPHVPLIISQTMGHSNARLVLLPVKIVNIIKIIVWFVQSKAFCLLVLKVITSVRTCFTILNALLLVLLERCLIITLQINLFLKQKTVLKGYWKSPRILQ
jgi:hypothetical protein